MKWEGKFGPAAIIGIVGLLITLGAMTAGYGSLKTTVSDTERAVIEVRIQSADYLARIVRLETKIDLLMTTSPSKRSDLNSQ